MSRAESHSIHTGLSGRMLLENPLLNKGTAFTLEERSELDLHGLLPPRVETLEEQCRRAYKSFSIKPTPILKHIYLRSLQDTNETLFYALVQRHLEEMLPIIYTPVVGQACQRFSDLYRRPRGLYISYPERARMDAMLANFKRNIEVIVVTDGERILGLGDQGVGGMGICIGKLSLYSAVGGITPNQTLPIMLDCGTNNQKLLEDPNYLGWRHERIDDEQYYEFVESFIKALKRRWPNALLQFEDFAINHATPLLEKYRDELCSFNDDIQGTAGVTAATLLAAAKAADKSIEDMKIAFLGAGSAGCGIAEQIIRLMMAKGLSEEEARQRIYMVDRFGLVHDEMSDLRAFQQKLAQKHDDIQPWMTDGSVSLVDVVKHAKPDAIIGVSGQPGLFTQEIIEQMSENHEQPIVFPLSNPISQVEAIPEDIIKWSKGKALIATGSPFDPVSYEGRSYPIAQCNNIYIFPGLGLGALASGARRISDGMLDAAVQTLALSSPALINRESPLLPTLDSIQRVTNDIALAVALQAQKEELAPETELTEIEQRIREKRWSPEYRRIRMSYC
ncbi:malate dehydrogenase [Endozoicomonas montiporae]|uniref:malate dehydrogenase (oxaloacetate-decarboxylating) n=2 Tax=Endozoicomonas montiporae TaxID=1027273 RepID=A0A081MZV4_9GAMM|nr:NAD-dependent malic enzyme [Endozoicomonas montiporae]AMO54582.1 malate dehydrogenase [Endozoicomonas montiporae CL-33]KEQ11727.1 malate dehydrogenase [Endozoicomonas montiporae]